MAYQLPDGAIVSLANTYGAVKGVTAAANSNPAELTSAAHGLAEGDLIEVTSGWASANGRVFRVVDVDVNTFSLEGLDSTDVDLFNPGGGIGSVREITQFLQIPQVLEFTSNGGDQQFTTFSFLEDNFERQLPTNTAAQSVQITMADDPAQPGIIALEQASNQRAIRALQLALPNGSKILYNGYASYNPTPVLNKGQIMQVSGTFSLSGRPVRYAA